MFPVSFMWNGPSHSMYICNFLAFHPLQQIHRCSEIHGVKSEPTSNSLLAPQEEWRTPKTEARGREVTHHSQGVRNRDPPPIPSLPFSLSMMTDVPDGMCVVPSGGSHYCWEIRKQNCRWSPELSKVLWSNTVKYHPGLACCVWCDLGEVPRHWKDLQPSFSAGAGAESGLWVTASESVPSRRENKLTAPAPFLLFHYKAPCFIPWQPSDFLSYLREETHTVLSQSYSVMLFVALSFLSPPLGQASSSLLSWFWAMVSLGLCGIHHGTESLN